ncbi:alpha/beta hydrolase [Saccharothrix sp. ST-888]|uniref:alpha/beta hydrolase n=1 Tax=Saccharothrix sp. ST-888 TaxID=1427391 RepID=UPI0007C80AF0|nr:alpha/beta hydrolase [Saccharothrix sp. ST-888]
MAGRFRRGLAAAAAAAVVLAGAGGWAAADSQTPVTGPPEGSAAWVADNTLGVRLPDPAEAPAAEVARFFAGLTTAQRDALAARHPLVVGNLDGAPVELRYRANALALAEERRRELARAADPAVSPYQQRTAAERADRYAKLTDRQILAFDPRGRGQVAEVFGDLATAARTAVVVPGSDVDLMTFDRTTDPYGTPAGMARSLRQATGDRVAVVAWAGYTTPVGVGVDAATADLARAGAARLNHFLAGLAPVTGPVALFCHSYGSAVCGLADPSPEQVSDLVVLGSPGMDIPDARALRVPLWATERNPTDWIGNVPYVSVLGLGHGADPTATGFGARVLPSAGSHGHSGYFAPGTASLAGYTAVALGNHARGNHAPVGCADRSSRTQTQQSRPTQQSQECRDVR